MLPSRIAVARFQAEEARFLLRRVDRFERRPNPRAEWLREVLRESERILERGLKFSLQNADT